MRGLRGLFFLLCAVAGIVTYFFLSPIRRPESYHAFADRRTLWSVPYFGNEISNLPFAMVGILRVRSVEAARRATSPLAQSA